MNPPKPVRLTKKRRQELEKAWYAFNEIVEQCSDISLADFIKICPPKYELVVYENDILSTGRYALYNIMPWQFCVYFSSNRNRLALHTRAKYFNRKSYEWEITPFGIFNTSEETE